MGDRGLGSSLALFCRIRSGAVSLGEKGFLAPAPGLGCVRASHGSRGPGCVYCSGVLRDSFFSGAVPLWSGLPRGPNN